MNPRVVSDRVVHLWQGEVFTVFRLGSSIAGSIVCAVHDKAHDIVWIGLQDGRISAITLSQTPATTSSVIDLAPDFLNRAQTVSPPVGVLHGILVPTSKPRCALEAFGSAGWVRISATRKILHRANWASPLDALTHAALLPPGALRDSVASAGHALLATDACGRIFLARGKCIGDMTSGGRIASAPTAQLGQAVACIAVHPDGTFVAIIGELRAVVVLAGRVETDEDVCIVHAIVPGHSAAIDGRHVRCDFLSDGALRISSVESEQVLIIAVGDSGVPTCRTELNGVVASRIEEARDAEVGNGDLGESLASLLRGIEQAGALQEAAEERARRADARLASFNAALLFALQNRVKSKEEGGAKAGDGAIGCTFSASLVPAPESPPFFINATWVGVNAFINVHLKSLCTIAVGHGWNLRLTIERNASTPKSSNTNNTSGTTDNAMNDTDTRVESRNTEAVTSHSAFATQLSVPLPALPASGETVVSFPVALTSHTPLHASLDMHYTLASPPTAFPQPFATASELSRQLTLPLARHVVLDILTFSASTTSRIPDNAHLRLRGARLAHALSPPASPLRNPLPLSTRLSVPVSTAALVESLRPFDISSSGTIFRSFLGAEFMLELASQRTDGTANAQLMVRAPPLALPFVRAAILRRVARVAGIQDVAARSAGGADAWERRLVDAVEDCVPVMREAERAVADLTTLAKCIEQGRLEFCCAGEDLRAAKRASAEMERAMQRWRQLVRDMWDPDAGGGVG